LAKHCEVCGKMSAVGNTISHAHNVTRRRFDPNLQHVKIKEAGNVRRAWVCTRCLRSGKVEKA
jgi:large subunit ribosomal protein L28